MKTSKKIALKNTAKISVVPMITATYFMVAGGPYGLEDIVQKTGYTATLLILVITPLLWSLPTAMMVSELATAMPEEGGFYIWVRRGMGRFWGFQETWLTLAGSVFEMALYPNLFVDYIGQFAPGLVAGHRGLILGFAMIAICTAWNVLGVRAVGRGFGVDERCAALAVRRADGHGARNRKAFSRRRGRGSGSAAARRLAGRRAHRHVELHGLGQSLHDCGRGREAAAHLFARNVWRGDSGGRQLFNSRGRGCAHRDRPESLDDRAAGWTSGKLFGGETLAIAIAVAGVIGAIGSFGALMLSFTRLPLVMAEDGFLPRVFTRRNARTGAPWVAIVACAILWAACLPLGFEKSLLLDVLLTG